LFFYFGFFHYCFLSDDWNQSRGRLALHLLRSFKDYVRAKRGGRPWPIWPEYLRTRHNTFLPLFL
jgi:hypothetical protein